MEIFTKTLYTIIDGEIIYNGMREEESFSDTQGRTVKDMKKNEQGDN